MRPWKLILVFAAIVALAGVAAWWPSSEPSVDLEVAADEATGDTEIGSGASVDELPPAAPALEAQRPPAGVFKLYDDDAYLPIVCLAPDVTSREHCMGLAVEYGLRADPSAIPASSPTWRIARTYDEMEQKDIEVLSRLPTIGEHALDFATLASGPNLRLTSIGADLQSHHWCGDDCGEDGQARALPDVQEIEIDPSLRESAIATVSREAERLARPYRLEVRAAFRMETAAGRASLVIVDGDADFEGDGDEDLLYFGNPFGVIVPERGSPALLRCSLPEYLQEFGEPLALIDIDGDGDDELVVRQMVDGGADYDVVKIEASGECKTLGRLYDGC